MLGHLNVQTFKLMLFSGIDGANSFRIKAICVCRVSNNQPTTKTATFRRDIQHVQNHRLISTQPPSPSNHGSLTTASSSTHSDSN
ncbi:unnamed protein product, partial [Vitis vinifera]|uniref:Uncharacterized protein n=1 Tax=Vitis vinifera TaxID=29760 RepID=D7U8M0_VITVI